MGGIYHKTDRKGRKVYYVDYRVMGIRKRERVGYTEKEAEEALQSRMTDIRRQKFDGIFPEPSYTLLEVRDQYLKFSKTTKSPQTCDREQGIIDDLLIPFFDNSSLNKISVQQVDDYRSRRAADGVAAATINKEVQLLKHIVKKAVEWGKIRTNQIANLKPLKTPPGRVRYLQPEQIPRLMKACPPWLRPYSTGRYEHRPAKRRGPGSTEAGHRQKESLDYHREDQEQRAQDHPHESDRV